MLYRRGEVWWFRLKFAGTILRESSKSRSKALARRAERKRLQELEEGFNGLRKRQAPLTFAVAAGQWANNKSLTWSAKTLRSELTSISHLNETIGQRFLTDITPETISSYQRTRLGEGASPKTVNLEIAT